MVRHISVLLAAVGSELPLADREPRMATVEIIPPSNYSKLRWTVPTLYALTSSRVLSTDQPATSAFEESGEAAK